MRLVPMESDWRVRRVGASVLVNILCDGCEVVVRRERGARSECADIRRMWSRELRVGLVMIM